MRTVSRLGHVLLIYETDELIHCVRNTLQIIPRANINSATVREIMMSVSLMFLHRDAWVEILVLMQASFKSSITVIYWY